MTPTFVSVLTALAAGVGSTLLLSRVRWFRRVPLVERIRPFHTSTPDPDFTCITMSSFREVITPLARRWGDGLARLVGLRDDVGTRLARIRSPLDPTQFRIRQLGWSMLAFAGGAIAATALAMPPIVGLAVIFGLPVLAALVAEQQLAHASADYQRRVFLELPVVAEQLGMLLGAGYSLGAALDRLARRGSGTVSTDLESVSNRIQQGLGIDDALDEWAELADVDELTRLVHILTLHQAASDLGPLISAEARSIRREAHRRLIVQMEQRSQLVWIPVTVAALLPGAIFLAVPFADALRLVTS